MSRAGGDVLLRRGSPLAACAVLLALVLTGCSSDAPKPSSLSSASVAPSATPSARPSAATPLAEPTGRDAASARAFVRYWVQELNRASATGDTAQLSALEPTFLRLVPSANQADPRGVRRQGQDRRYRVARRRGQVHAWVAGWHGRRHRSPFTAPAGDPSGGSDCRWVLGRPTWKGFSARLCRSPAPRCGSARPRPCCPATTDETRVTDGSACR